MTAKITNMIHYLTKKKVKAAINTFEHPDSKKKRKQILLCHLMCMV